MSYSELQFKRTLDRPIDTWNSDDCMCYLFGLEKEGIKFGLDNISNLLSRLSDPQHDFKSIHIAGTNGKGSSSLLLSSVLKESGYSVGLYTSPHLIKFNERIRINGNPVSDEILFEQIRKIAKTIRAFPVGVGHPTYFEFGTALAFSCFAEQKVDFAIIEVGMGGRLDATNVIKPILSLITNIGLEHQEYLGNDIVSIAREKAGIIKEAVPVLTTETKDEVISVFRKVCKDKKTKLRLAKDFWELEELSSGLWGQEFSASSKEKSIIIRMQLLGGFQLKNAKLVLAAIELLRDSGVNVPEEGILEGFKQAFWEGRMHVLRKSPITILDGAHNPKAIKELRKSIEALLPEKKITIVFGVLGDKDVEKMMSALFPCADRVIISAPKIDRGAPVADLYKKAEALFPDMQIFCFDSLDKAFEFAILENEGVVLVTGSLYTAGEILENE